MNFYKDIAHRLYVWKTEIGDTKFSSPFDFIEAKHNEAPYKGKVFYENLLSEMPDHFGAGMRYEFFKEIIQYCKHKIDTYKSPYEKADFVYSISGEPLFFEIQNDNNGARYDLNEYSKKSHALDIYNESIISIDGSIKHPEQNFYDNKFIAAINATKNKAETIRYINHHYSNAINKNVFLRKIDSLFDRIRKYPFDEVLTPDARSVLLEWYNVERAVISQNNESTFTEQTQLNLSSLITHQESIKIVESIKIQYKNIKGKRLKLLLLAFQELELLPSERIAQKFHQYCKDEFNWNISSYNAMNGYEYNANTDEDELLSMKQFLEKVINKR